MGRASILMVLGLSFAMAIFGPSAARYSRNSYTNALGYFSSSNVHNIALSGANVGANMVFMDRTWTAGYSNVPFSQGWYSVTVARLPLPDTARIKISAFSKYYGWNGLSRQMDTLRDTVWCILGPSSFAKFAVYLKNMTSASWATGDTVFGPMHIDGTLKYSGNPVFYGKVTVLSGKSGSGTPKFIGGYQSGVSLPLPTDISKTTAAATAGGKVFTYPSGSGQHKVRINFNGDSTINYSQWRGTVKVDTQSNVKFRTLAPNMVCWVQGLVEVKGTYMGQLTIAAGPITAGTRDGTIMIVGNVVAKTSPRSNANSTDLLGLVADSSVYFPLPWNYTTAAPNAPHDYLVDAAIFCRVGTFVAVLESHMGAQGAVNICGSLCSANIGAFGSFNGSGVLQYGYSNIFGYDNRFYTSAPPYYPNTGAYEAISWYE